MPRRVLQPPFALRRRSKATAQTEGPCNVLNECAKPSRSRLTTSVYAALTIEVDILWSDGERDADETRTTFEQIAGYSATMIDIAGGESQ